MFRLMFNPFSSPDDSITSEVTDDTVEEVVEETVDDATDDEEDDSSDDDTDDDDSDGEGDPLDEIDEDDEEVKLVTPTHRAALLKDYPDLFKKHPYLEKALFRDQKFTELIGDPSEAQELLEKANALDNFESDLLAGKSANFLQAALETDREAFNHLIDGFLPTLAKVDEKAYYNVIGSIVDQTVVSMVNEGKRSNNEALISAASLLYQFAFGESEYKKHQPLSKRSLENNNEELTKIQNERNSWNKQRFEHERDSLVSKISNTLKASIDASLDPRNVMPNYIRKNATKDIQLELQQLMGEDKTFTKRLDIAWKKAISSNYSPSDVDSIRKMYLGRAKALLPSVLNKVRKEALKGLKLKESKVDIAEPQKKGPVSVGKSTARVSQSGKSYSERAKEIPAGMSTRDFLLND